MSDLIVIAFDRPDGAQEAYAALERLTPAPPLDLGDACVVLRNSEGMIKIRQTQDLVVGEGMEASSWGPLIKTLCLDPRAGILVGGSAEVDLGVLDDAFVRRLGRVLRPGTSAIFVRTLDLEAAELRPLLEPYGAELLATNLSLADDARLDRALREAA